MSDVRALATHVLVRPLQVIGELLLAEAPPEPVVRRLPPQVRFALVGIKPQSPKPFRSGGSGLQLEAGRQTGAGLQSGFCRGVAVRLPERKRALPANRACTRPGGGYLRDSRGRRLCCSIGPRGRRRGVCSRRGSPARRHAAPCSGVPPAPLRASRHPSIGAWVEAGRRAEGRDNCGRSGHGSRQALRA